MRLEIKEKLKFQQKKIKEYELLFKDYKGRIGKNLRQKVLERDLMQCVLCNESEDLQLHHLREISRGGKSSFFNLITVCRYCHWYLHFNPKNMINHRQLTILGLEKAKQRGIKLGRPYPSREVNNG